MPDLTTIAQRLRTARRLRNEFLGRWAAESLIDRPISLDCVLGAIEGKNTDSRPVVLDDSEPRNVARPEGRG